MLLAAFALALSIGCGRPPRLDPGVLLDPQFGPTEPSRFEQTFENRQASIRLGPGWYDPEKPWPGNHSAGIAWAERYSRVYFGVPLAREADFVAVGVPLVYPGAPQQWVKAFLNRRQIGTFLLPPQWSELRIPLPAAARTSPINSFELHFAYEAVPAKVGLGGDTRHLAAAFGLLAVVPRGAPLAARFPEVETAGPYDRRLLLRGEPLALPLPPAPRVELRLGAVRATEPGLRLAIDLLTPAGRRRLWQGAAEAASWRRFAVDFRRPRPARLLLSAARRGPLGEAAIEMAPPEIRAAPVAERPAGRPDVFVYLIDTLRADALGIGGAAWSTSPRIDRFSRDAAVFTEAHSPSAWTLPATFSILSGLYPSRHGVMVPRDRLPRDRQPWLPARMSQLGYETLGISQWLLGGDAFGLDRGFDSFYFNVRQNGKTPSASVRWFFWRHLLARLHPDRPLFCYLHVVDPHALYEPSGEDRVFGEERPGTLAPELYSPILFNQGLGRQRSDVQHLRALYDGEVHAADREFGAFVDLLKLFGLYDESVIVLVGDHGEEFAEHGGFDHGRTLYEELLRVPLLVKLPFSRGAGSRIERPVSSLDIAPTIVQLAGGPAADIGREGFDGRSLTGAAAGSPRAFFAETRADQVDLKSATVGAVKCIESLSGGDRFGRRDGRYQDFDLARDPGERSPLALSSAVARCRQLLQAWVSRPDRVLQPERSRELAPEDLAKLRALGYLR